MSDVSEQMIEQQVRAWHVLDAGVLDTLREVPRERFVPADHRYLAHVDAEVPLPCGQHMLRPSVTGRLLQALGVKKTDRALEIGAGSGYVTACLAARCAQVRSLEVFPELAQLAIANLAAQGLRNADVAAADASELDPKERYDVIAVTASLPLYDARFQEMLEIGGRLFVVVGSAPAMEARLVRRLSEKDWAQESLFETVVDPLIHARRREEFVF
jgi:protein-L-isoaspartate(D-aspartate) O-methyltransferase